MSLLFSIRLSALSYDKLLPFICYAICALALPEVMHFSSSIRQQLNIFECVQACICMCTTWLDIMWLWFCLDDISPSIHRLRKTSSCPPHNHFDRNLPQPVRLNNLFLPP
jgi:hypothetical protein